MRTCTLCGASAADRIRRCPRCGSDLAETSTTAVAHRQLVNNPRVSRIRLITSHDACPACHAATGEFDKDKLPALPIPGCSHALGCRCFYEPTLTAIYP